MTYKIPKDPNILFSYVNLMLRDRFESLQEFCTVNDVDQEQILELLASAGYHYEKTINQFR